MFSLHGLPVNGKREIFGHDAILVNDLDTRVLKILRKFLQSIILVHFGAECKSSGPSEDGCNRVGRGLIALLVLPIMASDGTCEHVEA